MIPASSLDQIRVHLTGEPASAEVAIPGDLPRGMLNASTLQQILRGQGIEVTPQVVLAVQALADAAAGTQDNLRAVVATPTLPVNGGDGYVEWLVDQHDPDAQQVSHYDRCAYVMVQPGQVVGRIVSPTPGADGRDIFGKTLPAKAGRALNLALNESLMLDAAGQLIAQQEGTLYRDRERAQVRQVIEIRGFVDFSTGNIDFAGDVIVKNGVRDKFIIKAAGSIHVDGLIEAATIECQGNLVARGGFAGREIGNAVIGGNLLARYLDNIKAHVRGSLTVDREIINCHLLIEGNIESPQALIIGGRVQVVGRVEVATLGSPSATGTELILGSVPDLEPLLLRLEDLMARFTERRELLEAEMKQINLNTRRLTAQDRERQTEIMFELQSVNERLGRGAVVLENLHHAVNSRRTVDLNVTKELHAGTLVSVGDHSFKITNDLRGPLRIMRDMTGEVVLQTGGVTTGRLGQVSEVKLRNAA